MSNATEQTAVLEGIRDAVSVLTSDTHVRRLIEADPLFLERTLSQLLRSHSNNEVRTFADAKLANLHFYELALTTDWSLCR